MRSTSCEEHKRLRRLCEWRTYGGHIQNRHLHVNVTVLCNAAVLHEGAPALEVQHREGRKGVVSTHGWDPKGPRRDAGPETCDGHKQRWARQPCYCPLVHLRGEISLAAETRPRPHDPVTHLELFCLVIHDPVSPQRPQHGRLLRAPACSNHVAPGKLGQLERGNGRSQRKA